MTIFKLLHEGDSFEGLRSTIRYNTKEKKIVNNENNPRLIGVSSNCGFCVDVKNEIELNRLKENFINTVKANKSLAKNSRQKQIYEHATISFSEEDDKKFSQEKLQEMALETCSIYDKNFENTPYLIFPQKDSGKLHFHIVRGFNDMEGGYHRQSRSATKMTSSAQKIEKKHNLTLTGKNNPDNWFVIDGKKTYIPKKDQKNGIFDKVYRLDEKVLTPQEAFIDKINKAYRENQTSTEFIEKINSMGITIQYTERKNGNGGITFVSDDFAIAGGKVNSVLTFGKLKKNNPELLKLITDEKNLLRLTGSGYQSNKDKYEIDITELNILYKQFKTALGETFIYYNKKDNEKNPNNYNLKISEDKTTITFGQMSNDYDLKLAYELAKKSGWTGANSENKDLILRAMRVAFEENPNDLFYFETKEKETLKLDEIKDIIKDAKLSKNNLIILNDKNVIKPPQNEQEEYAYRDFLGEKLEKLGIEKEKVFDLLDEGKSLSEILSDDYDTLQNQYEPEKEEYKPKTKPEQQVRRRKNSSRRNSRRP